MKATKLRIILATAAVSLLLGATGYATLKQPPKSAIQVTNTAADTAATTSSDTAPIDQTAQASTPPAMVIDPAPTAAPASTPVTQPALAPAPASISPTTTPARKVIHDSEEYVTDQNDPTRDIAMCYYDFDDGSHESLQGGSRPKPGTQGITAEIGCPSWNKP